MHRRVKSLPIPDPIRVPEREGAQHNHRSLTESDAIEIWIAKWLRVRRRDLCQRYGCDPRRLYEIWTQERFPAARDKAREVFAERHPGLIDRIDFGRHRRLPKDDHQGQLALFD